MFKIENINPEMFVNIGVRPFNFGSENSNDAKHSFVWKENIDYFLEITGSSINGFIQECLADDRSQEEPDIPYLYNLNYPSAYELLVNHTNYFFELITDYTNLILSPFFDTDLIFENKKSSLNFAINNIDKVYIENDMVIFEGRGFLAPMQRN